MRKPLTDSIRSLVLILLPILLAACQTMPAPKGFTPAQVATLKAEGFVATIDADGYIRIVDRLKDMIAVGGFKVYPSVIEAHLHQHPGVKEAIVLGVPDSYRGEVPKAFVTLEDGYHLTGEELANWLNPQLGKHERVQAVEVRDSLPKTMIGKLDRKALRAEAGG